MRGTWIISPIDGAKGENTVLLVSYFSPISDDVWNQAAETRRKSLIPDLWKWCDHVARFGQREDVN